MKEVCIYHIAEQFLFEYYCQPGEYRISEEDHAGELLSKGLSQEKSGGLMGALQSYEKALAFNAVSTQIYFRLISVHFRLGQLEELFSRTKEVYPYLSTKAEMAQYYRWLGYYYLEKYQPELSAALYRYSTLFSKSAQAEEEIRYLEAAMDRKLADDSERELQVKLQKAGIPVTASNVTLALLYRAGQEALQHAKDAAGEVGAAAQHALDAGGAAGAGARHVKDTTGRVENATAKHWRQQALECFSMIYDLTEDAQIKEEMEELT